MSKAGNEEKKIQDAVKLAENNKSLIPKVKNWCKHLQIEDKSAGLIAEYYKLPVTLSISCPHTSNGYKAMNFEWIARDFILESCTSCEFHKEIIEVNFGRQVLEEKEQQSLLIKNLETEENEKKKELKEKIDHLLNKEKSNGEITTLSILNLVESLDDSVKRQENALKILEASKLSPAFFKNIAIDYMSLYFDDDAGLELLEATKNLIKTGNKLSVYSFQKLASTIHNNKHFDTAVGILYLIVDDKNYIGLEALFNNIVNSLVYERRLGDAYDKNISYPNSINLLQRINEIDPTYYKNLIKKHLEVNEKSKRININGLLQELISTDPGLVKPFTELIIYTLEFEDDGYGDSADRVTCLTLKALYYDDPQYLTKIIEQLYDKLSVGAKIELLDLFSLVLVDDKMISLPSIYVESIVHRLIIDLLNDHTDKKLKVEILYATKSLSKDIPNIFIPHFDSLLGFLIKTNKEYQTFNWYKRNLEKPANQTLTFNPLLGLNYFDISSLEIENQTLIREIESVIENVNSSNANTLYSQILKIICNLDSELDGDLKSRLIGILRRSLNNPIHNKDLLPYIYNYLFDLKSDSVRDEGLKYVIHLINNNTQIVTQTLLDTIKVLVDDMNVSIKGRAIEAYGLVIEKFPDKVEKEQINLILRSISDNYTFIHKKAASLSIRLLPFLDESERFTLINKISILEQVYFKEKQLDYCKELINKLLIITSDRPKEFSLVVKKLLLKYCSCKDYHTELDSIKKLTRIRNEKPEFSETWLVQTLRFLSRTQPDYNPIFDDRNRFIMTIYELPFEVIKNNITLIKNFVKKKIDEGIHTDILSFYSILGYFNFHSDIKELADYFNNVIPNNKSNELYIEMNETCRRISTMETLVSTNSVDRNLIKSLS